MIVEFIPRGQLRERIAAGWRLIEGHDYRRGDYAVVMHLPENAAPVTIFALRRILALFTPDEGKGWSNRSQSATSRNLTRSRRQAWMPKSMAS